MDVGKLFSVIVLFFLGLIEVLLGLRFVFMLLAANSGAEFTATIYSTTEPLVSPFAGVFPSFQVGAFTLEISTALGMIVYGIVGVILLQLARYFEGMRVKSAQVTPTPLVSAQPSMPVQQMSVMPQAPQVAQPYQVQPQQPIIQQTPPYPATSTPLAQNPPTPVVDQSIQAPPPPAPPTQTN